MLMLCELLSVSVKEVSVSPGVVLTDASNFYLLLEV